jgi:hypothetical protein
LLDILLEGKIGAVPILTPDTGELIGMVSYEIDTIAVLVHTAQGKLLQRSSDVQCEAMRGDT